MKQYPSTYVKVEMMKKLIERINSQRQDVIAKKGGKNGTNK